MMEAKFMRLPYRPDPSIASPAGMKVKCRNGHLICEVVKDIRWGQKGWASSLGRWQQDEPQIGTPIAELTCAKCGAMWAYEGASGAMYLSEPGSFISIDPPPREGRSRIDMARVALVVAWAAAVVYVAIAAVIVAWRGWPL